MSSPPSQPAYLLLEDGARFEGEASGALRDGVAAGGEVVFTTGMSGYQESVTDPSFAGQLVVFAYPLIGNYGVRAEAMESDVIHARAVVMREAVNYAGAPSAEHAWIDWLTENGIPAITGVDTRALVRHIRDKGAMRGGLFPGSVAEADAAAQIAALPTMAGLDLASTVTPKQAHTVGADQNPDGPLIAAIDTGIKRSIINELVHHGARVRLHPLSDGPDAVLAGDVDAVFLANGPGDPEAVPHVVDTIRGVLGKKPVFGICLGHQLLCRAVGLETFKLPFGHRGGNHPVKDLSTGRVEITSQNHGFAVQTPDGTGRIERDEPIRWETSFGPAELSHLNLYDRTVEGLILPDANAATVQYHPEAAPGPNDSSYLFTRFLDRIVRSQSLADATRQTGEAAAAAAGLTPSSPSTDGASA